ncbi:RNA-directed DNA polymerase, eukaryota, partial [Tanacetum coccineum]
VMLSDSLEGIMMELENVVPEGRFVCIYAKMVISELISDVQYAFVSNRQILDGPFILNEIISWCKAHKSKAMIFKVDFEKAFDSVRWDFLNIILRNFGFGIKWRGWIQGCLSSAMGSILVNGSPTAEFKFHKGLKQGDPLSPYLFILVMESLHLSFNNIINADLFKGIRFDDSLTLSHLFYADDAVFIGKWDRANILTIVRMLKCFFLASGLQINILKSKLMGIGVSNEEVLAAANIIGCSTFSTPFSYLGVKVGMSPSRRKAWDEIIGYSNNTEIIVSTGDPNDWNKETRNNSFASVLKSNQPNNLSSSNMIHDSSPAIALDDDCLSANDLSCVAIGKIKDINALSNLSVILNDEGFDDIKISYLGGYWVLIQSKSCASKEKLINHAGVLNWFHELGNANNSFVSDIRLVWIAIEGLPMCAWNNKALSKIVSPWGTLTPVDLVEDSSLPYRKVCVTTKVSTIINDRTKIIVKGKVYWIRIRELEPWSPELDDEFCESSSDDEFVGDEKNNSITGDANDHVSESSFMNENIENVINEQEPPQDKISEDPFGIYNILNKQDNKEAGQKANPSHPPVSLKKLFVLKPKSFRSRTHSNLCAKLLLIMGPSPFRDYHSGFTRKVLINVIKGSWSYSSSNDSNKIILLKKKLQALKASIKEWCKDDIKRSNDTCFSIKARLSDLDKWRIGFDEPCKVKNEFLMHFANRFESPSGPCIDIDCHLFKKLSSEQVDDLECDVTFDEIKKAERMIQGCLSSSNGNYSFKEKFASFFHNNINADLLRVSDLIVVDIYPHLFYADLTLMGVLLFHSVLLSWCQVRMSPLGERAWDEIIGSVSSLSPWNCILKELNSLSAKDLFPRLYALELKKGITVADKLIDASFVASFSVEPPWRGGRRALQQLGNLLGPYNLYLLPMIDGHRLLGSFW